MSVTPHGFVGFSATESAFFNRSAVTIQNITRNFAGLRVMVDYSSAKVLLVDDSPHVVQILQALLAQLGFGHILTASGVDEAFSIIERDALDLVITDYMMTPKNGLDLVRKVRDTTSLGNRHVPILMLSGLVGDDFERDAKLAGVSAVCSKPIGVEQLLSQIVRLVSDCGDKHRQVG